MINKIRIISLVPSQTELLVDLGLEDSIVGITKFCVHPKHLKKAKTIVGGTKNIHVDKIKALKPDIILCNKEENTKDIVENCRKITTTHVSEIYTLNDAMELITHYGNILNCVEKSVEIRKELEKTLYNFNQFIQHKKIKKVVYFIWRNPWMVAGNNTFINHLLELNRFENIYATKSRYPEISLDSIPLNDTQPDLVLLSSEPYPFKLEHVDEITKHIHQSKVIFVDGEMFSWYGSRLLKAFDYFKKLRDRT